MNGRLLVAVAIVFCAIVLPTLCAEVMDVSKMIAWDISLEAIHAGRYEEYVTLISKYLNTFGASPPAYMNMAVAYNQIQRPIDAFFVLYVAKTLQPDARATEMYLNQLEILSSSWELSRARILQENKRRSALPFEKAVPYIKEVGIFTDLLSGKRTLLQEALDMHDFIAHLDNSNPQISRLMASIYKSAGKLNEAAEYFLKAIQKSKHLDEKETLAVDVAHIYFDLNQIQKAIDVVLPFVDQGSVTCAYPLVQAYCMLHRFDEALAILLEIDAQLPKMRTSPEFLSYLGNVYSLIGKNQEAYDVFTQLIKVGKGTKWESVAYHNRAIEDDLLSIPSFPDFVSAYQKYFEFNEYKTKHLPSYCKNEPLFQLDWNIFDKWSYILTVNPDFPRVSYHLDEKNTKTTKSYATSFPDKKTKLITASGASVIGVPQVLMLNNCTIFITNATAVAEPQRIADFYTKPFSPMYEHVVAPWVDEIGGNYYHFIVDYLPKLILLKEQILDVYPESIVVRSGSKLPQNDLFEIFNIPASRVVGHVGRTQAKKLSFVAYDTVPVDTHHAKSGTSSSYFPPADVVYKLREKLAVPAKEEERTLIIYLHRSSSHRSVRNFELISSTFSKAFGKDFVIYEGRTTLQHQVALFSKARLIFGPHGAALSNIIWTPQGTPLVEFPLIDHDFPYFHYLCAVLGREYWTVPEVSAKYESFYSLDETKVDRILQTVRAALSSLKSTSHDEL